VRQAERDMGQRVKDLERENRDLKRAGRIQRGGRLGRAGMMISASRFSGSGTNMTRCMDRARSSAN
jgi:hypothetical protein